MMITEQATLKLYKFILTMNLQTEYYARLIFRVVVEDVVYRGLPSCGIVLAWALSGN